MNTSVMHTSIMLYRRHKYSFVVIVAAAMLLVIMLLPLLEIVSRPLFGQGIPGSINYVRHATLWFGYLGAVVAANKSRHISLGVSALLAGRSKTVAELIALTLAAVTCMVLAKAALDMAVAESRSEVLLGGYIPLWLAQSVMPVSFVLLAYRYVRQLMQVVTGTRLVALTLAVIAVAYFADFGSAYVLPVGLLVILVATLAGTPVYIVLGSLAALLFATDGIPLASISVEAYRIASNPILPTIPLFTLAGTVLAAGKASSQAGAAFRSMVWLDARRFSHCGHPRLRVLHDFYRRFRSDHPCAGRTDAAHIDQAALPGKLFTGGTHIFRQPRHPVAAQSVGHSLRSCLAYAN